MGFDSISATAAADEAFSPAKLKGVGRSRASLMFARRFRPHLRLRLLLLSMCIFFFALLLLCYCLSPFIGWTRRLRRPSSFSCSSPHRCGYTVLINTWKRNNLLRQAIAHYATCSGTNAIRVVWSESDPPPDTLKAHLKKLVSQPQNAHKLNLRFELNEEDNLNNRFKPIKDLKDDAIFSVDDDVIVPCSTLNHAYTVWETAPETMVGFVPRMHWLDKEKHGVTYYKYGGWWSVWWMGTYSMVLSKAAFMHRKYLDLYTYNMPSSIHDYVTRERNCEDIAMSLLVANASGVPPIWVKAKIYEIGSFGISSLKGHAERRTKCLNDFVSLYGSMPLVPTNMKAVDSREEWFW